jgi:uncharacterized protein (TIGR02246 family)
MKSVLKLTSVILMLQFTTPNYAQNKEDTIAIHNIVQEETASWNTGDAKAYSKHFAKDGTFTNILGLYFTGNEDFRLRHDQIFKVVFKGTKLTQIIVSLRFVGSEVAILETLTLINGFSKEGPPKGTYLDEKGRLRTRLLQVMVKDGNDWKIVVYHNVDIKPGIIVPDTN